MNTISLPSLIHPYPLADPDKRDSELRVIKQRDLGDGFTEVS